MYRRPLQITGLRALRSRLQPSGSTTITPAPVHVAKHGPPARHGGRHLMADAGTTHDVAIIGAGSAGIAAAKTARALGLDYVVLEASHRIGGRGYTEELVPGVAFDLGCHWMHTASLNP